MQELKNIASLCPSWKFPKDIKIKSLKMKKNIKTQIMYFEKAQQN